MPPREGSALRRPDHREREVTVAEQSLPQSGVKRENASSREREDRQCRSCYGAGSVLEDASYDARTGELVQAICECPVCEGAGSVSVYLYSSPRRS